jgi:hypothetical protein
MLIAAINTDYQHEPLNIMIIIRIISMMLRKTQIELYDCYAIPERFLSQPVSHYRVNSFL